MNAAELAKVLMEHPDWEVEVEGVTCSNEEPERWMASPEVDELPKRKKFFIYAA